MKLVQTELLGLGWDPPHLGWDPPPIWMPPIAPEGFLGELWDRAGHNVGTVSTMFLCWATDFTFPKLSFHTWK